MTMLKSTELLVSDSYGRFIPKEFVETILPYSTWRGIEPADREICKNPEHREYWHAWDAILFNAYLVVEEDSIELIYRLHQDGDLWMVCETLMSDNEYEEFFGEKRES